LLNINDNTQNKFGQNDIYCNIKTIINVNVINNLANYKKKA